MLRIACKILLLSCLLLPACATSDDGKPINFSLTAKQNYEKGLAELKEENYQEASRYFAYVKQKFPFSKYAALAELAAADTEFARGTYQEAIDVDVSGRNAFFEPGFFTIADPAGSVLQDENIFGIHAIFLVQAGMQVLVTDQGVQTGVIGPGAPAHTVGLKLTSGVVAHITVNVVAA